METNAPTGHLYTEDVAGLLNVTVMTFRTMRKTARTPEPIGKIGTRLVWDAQDVNEWLEERLVARTRCACIVDGCTNVGWVGRGGRCCEHAAIRSLTGFDRPGPTPYRPRNMTLAERLASWTILDPDTGCLLWTGTVKVNGYGEIDIAGTTYRTHRVAWELVNGPIPETMTVDHLCNHPLCLNVRHMEVVSAKENVRREHVRLAARKAAVASVTQLPNPAPSRSLPAAA